MKKLFILALFLQPFSAFSDCKVGAMPDEIVKSMDSPNRKVPQCDPNKDKGCICIDGVDFNAVTFTGTEFVKSPEKVAAAKKLDLIITSSPSPSEQLDALYEARQGNAGPLELIDARIKKAKEEAGK